MATLTDTKISETKEGVLTDESSPGLRLNIGKTKKTWVYRFRDKRTKKLQQITLGYFNPKLKTHMGLADARLQWAEMRASRDQGENVKQTHQHQQEGDFTVERLVDLCINGYF